MKTAVQTLATRDTSPSARMPTRVALIATMFVLAGAAGCTKKPPLERAPKTGAAEATSSGGATPPPGAVLSPGSASPTLVEARAAAGVREAHYVGDLQPEATIDLMTTVGGRLMQVLKRLGDVVEKGEVVAVMDDEELRKQVHEANVAVEVAKVAGKRAESERARAASEQLRTITEVKRAEVEARRTEKEYRRQKPLLGRDVMNLYRIGRSPQRCLSACL